MMNLILLGMNHKTAPLDLRERLSISCEGADHPLREIIKIPGLDGVFYLSTCNRVEVLAQTTQARDVQAGLQEFILRHGNLSREELVRCLYVHEGQEAVRHLFRVTSSLDSLVMGEPQIVGQVKDAYRQAVETGTTGIILNKVMHYAFRVAKRVRTETGLAANAVSVSFAAVELAKKIFGGLQGKTVLLIGAGEMSELAARHLINYGAAQILIANRTPVRSEQMAQEFHGRAVPMDRIEEALGEVDIVISSTGASGYVITAGMVAAALRRRKSRLLFLIDIAVPRDIDPAAGAMENVFLYNIDNLQDIVDENVRGRMQEAQKAEAIISEEVSRFNRWYNTLAVVPTIVSFKDKAEGILRAELDRSSAWMQHLTQEDRDNIEILAGSIVNKILHDPIISLKEESQDYAAIPYVAALRRLFKLEDE
jgi:glutamyl-tRNA reductase